MSFTKPFPNASISMKVKVTQSCLFATPWTVRRSDQSILKEINPKYSLEGLTLPLELQYLGYLMQRANTLEKTLMLGKIEGRRRRGGQKQKQEDRGQGDWMASLT